MLNHAPAEKHRVQFRFCWLALCHDISRDLVLTVSVLHQHSSGNRADVDLRPRLTGGRKQADEPQIFFFCKRARASASNSGAMMTSLKISLMALATGSSIGRLQMMIPPNGARLSVA